MEEILVAMLVLLYKNPFSRTVFFLLLCTVAILVPNLTLGMETLVQRQAIWKFDDTGSDLGTSWRLPGFEDTSWLSGPAPLGYGEPYINTNISFGGDPGHRHITTYFRIEFTLTTNPDDISGLFLRSNFDDGYVAYLNGFEISRQSMPDGPISSINRAFYHEGGMYEFEDISHGLPNLEQGSNVLAIELHQQSASSSDLVFDMELFFSTIPAALIRGPYLQNSSPTQTTIRWRTHIPTDSQVAFGHSRETMENFVDDSIQTTEHEILLSGLSPESNYYYSVGTSAFSLGERDSCFSFKTPPLTGSHSPVRIWVIGDSGSGTQTAETVRNGYLDQFGLSGTDLWLMLGDNAYNDGTDIQYQAAVFEMYPELLSSSTLWPTRGNHDDLYEGPNNDYFDFFTLPTDGQAGGLSSSSEAYYSFDFANIHFVSLDTEASDRSPEGPMLTWLEADLATSDQDWLIAFWHQPPYSDGSHNSDDPGPMSDMRNYALPILEDAGADLILSGHSHAYERSCLLHGHYGQSTSFIDSMCIDPGNGTDGGTGIYFKPDTEASTAKGTVYAVVGCSASVYEGPFNHPAMVVTDTLLGSMVIDVTDQTLVARFIGQDGETLDSFTIFKGQSEMEPAHPIRIAAEPNPFSADTNILYILESPGQTTMKIFNLRGQLIKTLVDSVQESGRQSAIWNGNNSQGIPVSSGVYLIVLRTNKGISCKKVVFTN